MPKGRMLNRSISQSKKVAALSPQATLLFTWCIPHLDLKGRIYANSHTLKGIVTPYLDYMTHEIIEECKIELCAAGLVFIYGDSRYMQFIGFSHNQRIDPTREATPLIPDPTPKELEMLQKNNNSPQLQSNSRVTPDTSISTNINIIKKKPESSPALQEAFNKIIKDGFNIYPLLIKTKKALKQPAEFEFPEEVLLKVCDAYWREKPKIREPWPWFIRVLRDEWSRWNVSLNITKVGEQKKDRTWEPGSPESIGDILRRLVK